MPANKNEITALDYEGILSQIIPKAREGGSVKRMGFRILASLSVLAALVFFGYVSAEQRITATKFISDVMNNIGRQEMVTQRISLLSRSMIDSPYPTARDLFRKEIVSLAAALQKDHVDLIKGDLSKKLSKGALAKVQAIYLDGPYFLEQDISRLISSAQSFADSPTDELNAENPYFFYITSLAQSDQLVKALGQVVNVYKEESAHVINRAVMIGRVQLALFFAVFLGMVLFVFKPMAQQLRNEMTDLEGINEKLGHHTQVLSETNRKLKDKEGALIEIMEDLAVQKKRLQGEIDERTKAEKALEKEKNTAQMYLDIAGVIFVFIDMDNVVRLINKKGCQILGYSEKDIIGQNWLERFVPQNVKDLVKFEMDQIVQSGPGVSKQSETPILLRDGAERLIAWQNTLVVDETGKTIGTLCSGEDVTEKRAAEAKQGELMGQLERANHELSDFSYVVSHDLKAPLRGIGSLASWIATDYADKFDEQGKENINLIIGRVKRMHDLIDGLLQLARIGAMEGLKKKTDLKMILHDVQDILAIPSNFEVTVSPTLPEIVVDPTRIQQVFQNLLSNAIKYMDKKEGKIHVDWQEDDHFWHFSVQDNGPGIDKKHFEKIFQIFQTLAPRDTYESTGIGLTLVKKIVETYGGKIWVDSELKKGTTFFFTLAKSLTTKETNENQTAHLAH